MSTILELIGNTPQVEIKSLLKKDGVRLFAKLESHNPGGSVKDRAAYSMIKGALERGEIKEGTKLIEPTSGNTGIALAMIARLYNLDIELVMPENSTAERMQTMKAFGAKVTLTAAYESIEGSIDYAHKKVADGGYYMLNQFANPDNSKAHYHTTGPEIWKDTGGKITHFVSAMGTTGTIMGVSRFLKEQNPEIQIVGIQPVEGSRIPGIRRWPEKYLPKIFDHTRVDHTIDVSEQESIEMARKLAAEEAIFGGISSGGAVAGALKLAEQIESGHIVCVICDRGDRYLSSDLFHI
jgi:cysteine synthase B